MRSHLVLALLIGCAGPGSNAPTRQSTEAAPATEPAAAGSADPLADIEQEVLAEVPLTSANPAQVCPDDDLSPATTTLAREHFARAEKFFQEEFMPYQIPSAPKTKVEADRVLGTLVRLANEAQERYLTIVDIGGPLELAARVRVGDIRFFQAHKIVSIPTPQSVIAKAANQPNGNLLMMYTDAIDGLVRPLKEQARQQWMAAIEKGKELCISNAWTVLATVRLASLRSPQ